MSREAITTSRIAPSGGPFSPAIRAGELVYLSGQVGQDPATGRLVEGGVTAQTEQILKNIEAVLHAAGKTLDDVVSVRAFLADMRDFEAMNAVYATYFPTDPPARSTVAGSGLALGARVEIECVAVAGSGGR